MQYKIKNFKQLIGKFDSTKDEKVYKIVANKFELKR